MEPQTTIICAVYSKDPNRRVLLEQHAKNIAAQTVPVSAIYVFENGDKPDTEFKYNHLISSEQLTIYEAWNIALSACRTPFVMNLNLDDRLNIDAVETMQTQLIDSEADLVGGDWKICYTQEETNRIGRCEPALNTPFVDDWPPKEGTLTRLGSGTGNRGTYGPATMWRMTAHLSCPRYPYRTETNYRLKSVADGVWWSVLEGNFKKKLLRLPIIIGRYHSHPGTQAEFRACEDEENLKTSKILVI